jgi:type II secretory pathway pseudopilin PulG
MLRFPRNDDGNILITVVLVSMMIGSLAALTMRSAENADRSSTRDRNHEVALGVAEAGVQQAIARIESLSSGPYVDSFSIPAATTPEGTYNVEVTRDDDGFVIDSEGTTGGTSFGRTRHIRVTMRPPLLFPVDLTPAFFSSTSLELKNNGVVHVGDVWANDALVIKLNTEVNGSITSAQGWIQLENGTSITGDAWSGGHNVEGWAIEHKGNSIGGSVKASVSAPTCEEPAADYDIEGSGDVGGDLTTWGTTQYSGDVGRPPGSYHTCTIAPPAIPMPAYSFDRDNYDDPNDPNDYHEFTIEQFHAYIDQNHGALQGTFVVLGVPSPSASNRIELCVHNDTGNCVNGTQVSLGGDTTIYTDAPVYTADIDDAAVTDHAKFIVLSTYDPPAESVCDVDQDDSECVIYAKNQFQFDGNCKTAVFLYAPYGPVAVKNNGAGCGTVMSEGILMKNGLEFQYDSSVDRILGFGPTTFVIARWEELPPS